MAKLNAVQQESIIKHESGYINNGIGDSYAFEYNNQEFKLSEKVFS